ncbi:hypothetical protein KXR53_10460 [Inquilinus limosus]|uniref:hypothetical protein n=1 Tax=Inquilinus limosus TaxID=171674 RepID=UPI003F179DAF
MTRRAAVWRQDGIDPGWFFAEGIGSVRSSKSYNRPGGWWFLPAWLSDTEEHDIGPFRSKALALSEAERLTAERHRQSRV